jgi:hypothetical protein
VDLALLAAAMLDEIGVSWRLVRGSLDNAQAGVLLSTVVPVASATGVEGATDLFDPAADRWRKLIVQNHWWVEAEGRGEWQALDPAFPGLALGEATGEPLERFETGAIPPQLEHEVRIRVMVRNRRRAAVEVLSYSADLADLSYRNLVLTFRPDGSRNIRPSLDFAGELIEADSFERRTADRIWIEAEFTIGRSAHQVRRELRTPEDAIDLFTAELQLFSILIIPGWVGPDYYAAVARSQVPQLASAVADLVAAAQEESMPQRHLPAAVLRSLERTLAPTTGLIGLTLAHASDEFSLVIGRETGVRAYFSRPRMFIVGAIQRADGLAFQLDLRSNDIEAIAYAGLPTQFSMAFQALRGRLDAGLTGMVLGDLTGLPTLSASRILDSMWSGGVGFESISPSNPRALRRLELDNGVQDRIEEDVTSTGSVALAPRRAVEIVDGERSSWWLLAPTSGQLSGTIDDSTKDAVAGFLATGTASTDERIDPLRVASGALDLGHALVVGVVEAAAPGQPLPQPACEMVCDLQRIAAAACGGVTSHEVSRCLGGGELADDPIGLGLSCEEMVDSFRCGAALSAPLLGNTIEVDVDARSVFWGPWPDGLAGVEARHCDCP